MSETFDEIKADLRARIEAAGKQIVDLAKGSNAFEGTIVKSKTDYAISETGDGFVLTISNTSKIAAFLEFGTKPHIIRPRDPNGTLVFQQGGETVFAKSVNHPGNQAYRFIEDAIKQALPHLNP